MRPPPRWKRARRARPAAAESAVRTDDAPPLAGPLHTLTVATQSLAESRLFYERGWGLRLEGPVTMPDALLRAQRRLWALPPDFTWTTYFLRRDGLDAAAQIRLLVLDHAAPSFRSSWSPTGLGPYTIGFPNARQEQLDQELRGLGFGALNALERTAFRAPDGRQYDILETVHCGPDFVAAVGVARGAGEPGITPLDATGMGGPGYSMMIVDDVEPMTRFMTGVFGYSVRTRRVWPSTGRKGALNVPDGTEFDFVQLVPADAAHGFLVCIAFRNLATQPPAVPPRLPSRGLVLYTIAVTDVAATLARARALDATVMAGPLPLEVPGIGAAQFATLLAPNGAMFEVFSPAAPG